MVCLEVYSQNTTIKYKSTLCSKTTVFIFFTRLASILLPFIFAYNTKGFWLKNDFFFEQPDIKYKYEYIFIAETENLKTPILCSNVINFHTRFDIDLDKCSVITVREVDNNFDGKYDELFFNLLVEDTEPLRIQSLTLILPLDYKIYTTCHMQMQTTAIIQYFHINPVAQMNFAGDISLFQNSPMPCNSRKIFRDYNISLINNNFELWDFLEENFKRNISTKINNPYITWLSGKITTFHLNIRLRYSEQMIYYKPNFWQVIKFAWIQYLTIFVAIRWIINKIEKYVFTNKLVLYHVDNSLKKIC